MITAELLKWILALFCFGSTILFTITYFLIEPAPAKKVPEAVAPCNTPPEEAHPVTHVRAPAPARTEPVRLPHAC